MDADAFVEVHRGEWARLEELLRRRRRTAAEADELVALYQRTATHLSVVRSSSPDPALVGRLSTLVARARAAVTGSGEAPWREVARFVVVAFPAALWRLRWWATGTTAAFLAVAVLTGAWLVGNPDVVASLGPPEALEQYVQEDFESYYTEYASTSFAARVWTNNAWIAALCVATGISGVLPAWILLQNAVAVGQAGGLMVASDRGGVFFGLILPHGMLELTAVFVAAAAGLRLFWAWVDPGPRPRSQALAEEGRALVGVALGLAGVLLVSGLVEGFVTPSAVLPPWAKIAIGTAVWLAFLVYAVVLGRRAAHAGETGDVARDQAGDVAPVAG